jgi:hypothetical protein
MRLNKIEIRELRSFKIRLKTLTLKSFFEGEDNLAAFMMSDNIQPYNRVELRKQFAAYDLDLTFLSKKTLKIWMKNPEWVYLKNLLSGNVVQISPKNSKNLLSPKFTQEMLHFLMQQNYLDLRCVIWNQQTYRKERLKEYVSKSQINFKNVLIESTLKAPLIKSPLISGLFFAQTHY